MQENIKKAIDDFRKEKDHVNMSDVLDMYARIVYADHSDFKKIYKDENGEWVCEIDPSKIDGQIVEDIAVEKGEVKVKFLDKLKALESLRKLLEETEKKTQDETKNSIMVVTNVKRPQNQTDA